jgi:hypothetical protein
LVSVDFLSCPVSLVAAFLTCSSVISTFFTGSALLANFLLA